MKRTRKQTEEVEPTDAGYEHQKAVERLMSKLKNDALVPGGFVRYASLETQPAIDNELEADLRMFRCR
jgi:hypothetical protein